MAMEFLRYIVNSMHQSNAYSKNLYQAFEFTKKMGFNPDDAISGLGINKAYANKLVNELTLNLGEVIDTLARVTRDPVLAFATECGNVHFHVLKFIQCYYPDLNANLTVGDFEFDGVALCGFNQQKAKEWLIKKPQKLGCHVWITLGDDVILDCTGISYIQVCTQDSRSIGDVLFGQSNYFGKYPIRHQLYSEGGVVVKDIRYIPILVGKDAFEAIAP